MHTIRFPAVTASGVLAGHCAAISLGLALFLAQMAGAQTAGVQTVGAQTATGTDAAAAADAANSELQEIVVTGTLIRGTAPVGTEVLTTTREDIVGSGVVTTQDLLATIPAITNAFNTVPTVGTGASGLTIVRPNIHGLGASGGNTTLVLFDGHDVVGAGILQTTPDVGVLPPGVLDKVDVITDGGSAIYGADAVGGIVNFITRKQMEGVEADAHFGAADQYHAGDINISGGHIWDGGSFLLSYAYRNNTDLLGANRSYFTQDLTPFGGSDARVATCSPGNVTVGTTNYALPKLLPNTQNLCNQDLYKDIFPEETQNSVFGAFSQDLASGVTFDVTGYYTSRVTVQLEPQITSTGIIDDTNPYFIPVAGATSESVQYSYGGAAGNSFAARTQINEYGVTPEVKFDLNGGWDLTALLNYGRSKTQSITPEINATADAAALAGTTTATALDPYDLSLTNPAVLQRSIDYAQQASNVQQLAEMKVVAQGPTFSLPGGDARLAVGTQYEYQSQSALQTDAPVGDFAGAATAQSSQETVSVFGEYLVPIIGKANAFTGAKALDVDLSARYDHYNDFGGTTNPKFGLNWKPIDDLTVRASYSTSFVAPSLADEDGSVDTRAEELGVSPFGPGGFVPRPTYLLAGGGPDLKPEKGKSYTFGADYKPEWLPSTSLSLTYWHTKITDEISVYPFFSGAAYFNNYPTLYIVNPTQAQAQAFITSILGPNYRTQGPTLAQLYAAGNAPYAILDAERTNVGAELAQGVDFNLAYNQTTGFGSVNALVQGTYVLTHLEQIAPGLPYISEFTNAGTSLDGSRLTMTAQAGATVRDFSVRATLNYTSGFVVSEPMQNRVGSFHPVNLLFAYKIPVSGTIKNLTATLNVNNVFNESPAFENQTGGNLPDGTGNGETVGRFFNLGLHAKF